MASLAAFLSVRDLISGASDVFLLSNSILRPPITLHNSVFCRLEILEVGGVFGGFLEDGGLLG